MNNICPDGFSSSESTDSGDWNITNEKWNSFYVCDGDDLTQYCSPTSTLMSPDQEKKCIEKQSEYAQKCLQFMYNHDYANFRFFSAAIDNTDHSVKCIFGPSVY